MKLTANISERIEDLIGVEPISEAHPVLADLVDYFGEHTFFLTPDGLLVWELAENSEADEELLVAVRVAQWADDDRSKLAPHPPETTQTAITLPAGSMYPQA